MARSSKVQVATTAVDVQLYTGSGYLYGYSLRESAGTPAVATAFLRDGTGATDPVLVVLELAANGVETQWFGPQGIPINGGVYLDRVAGEVEGVLYIG